MPNQSQTTPGSQQGRQAPPQSDNAGKQAQKGQDEIKSPAPEHGKKPETGEDPSASPKTGKPS